VDPLAVRMAHRASRRWHPLGTGCDGPHVPHDGRPVAKRLERAPGAGIARRAVGIGGRHIPTATGRSRRPTLGRPRVIQTGKEKAPCRPFRRSRRVSS